MIYPVLDLVPDFSTAPQYGLAMAQDKLAIGEGRQRVAFPAIQRDHVFNFTFLLDTLAEVRKLKRFFNERGGRTHPFYLPSWRNDLPPIGGALASTLLTVQATDYEEDHLTEPATRPDHYGRQIFIWQPGEDLFTSRVISATEDGDETTLDLENTLTFTVDPAKAICGFLHLARFLDDRLSHEQPRPEICTTAIKFRGIRQHIAITQTNPVGELSQYASLGFVSITQDPAPAEPSDNRAAYASGPLNLHYSQDALYFTRWAAWTHNRQIRLKRLPAGEITFPDASGVSSALFGATQVNTDHLTLAFDQNGWEVIAYQKTLTTIELRQFYDSATTIRTWEGLDPILVFNQLIDPNIETGDSDVVCYYIKPNSNTLFYRFQRDDFGTEYVAAHLPARPITLKRIYIEDGFQYFEFLDAGFRRAVMKSAPLPEPPPPDPPPPEVPVDMPPDYAMAGAGFLSGDYGPAVVYADGLPFEALYHPPFTETSTAIVTVMGVYENAVVYADGLPVDAIHPAFTETTATGLSFTGVYEAVVMEPEPAAEATTAGLNIIDMEHTFYVKQTAALAETTNATINISGIYEPA